MHTPHEPNPKHQWVIGYMDWIFRHRWWVIVASVIAIAACGCGVFFLRVNPDTRIFFNPDGPEMKALDNLENTYSRANNVIIVLVPHSGEVFTRSTLAIVDELTKQAWKFPYAMRVDSITNYQYSYGKSDDFVVKNLISNPATLSDDELKRVRKTALDEPALVTQLISIKADVTAVVVTVVRADSKSESVEAIASAAHELVKKMRLQHQDVDFHLTGGIMADAAIAEAATKDIWQLVPLVIVLVIGTLWLGLRSAYGMIATLVVVLMSMIAAAGWAGWVGLELNPVMVGAPILSMTLAIADCVHVLSGAAQLQRNGYKHREAIVESMRLGWTPILMTSVTTAVAFFSINFADSPPLNDVGNIVAVGIIAAWLLCISFFPALLAVLPAPKQLPVLSDPTFLISLSRQVIKHKTPILIGSAILVSGLAAGMPRMKFDDNFINYFSTDYEFRRDTEVLQNRLTGLHALLYSVPSGRAGGVTEPNYLNTLDAFAEWFRKQDHVTHVSAMPDIIKRLNRNMHDNDPTFYRIPDSQELSAQYLLLYEMSLSQGQDLNEEIDITKSSSLVSVNLANVTSGDIQRLASEGAAWLKTHGITSHATGISVMYSSLTEYNIKAMMLGAAVELIAISFLMIFMLRSVKIGLISLVPNLVPAIMAFGLWGWIGYEVNLSVSAVAAITFGIVVDDTIHSLTKYMRARRDLRMDTLAAVEYTYVAAGDPMILTGLTLILGFGVLAYSGFAVTHQMGLLSACIIALAIVADLVLLPALLILLDKDAPLKKPIVASKV
jgi:predicted RND superfamily exporter protein